VTIIEVGVRSGFTRSTVVPLQPRDFPRAMTPDDKFGFIFVVTKLGYLYVVEVQSGKNVYGQKFSQSTLFAQVESDGPEGGIVTIEPSGRVRHFFVDTEKIVPYLCTELKDVDLAIALAKRHDMPGVGQMFKQQFDCRLQDGRHQEALELAASSPHGVLRTKETIDALQNIQEGRLHLHLQYFQILLNAGKLNKIESIELARALAASRLGLERISGYFIDQKLEPSEELGDVLKSQNPTLALSVYLLAQVPEKVIDCFLSLATHETDAALALDHLQKIVAHAVKVDYSPDYVSLLQQLFSVNPERAKDFALLLVNNPQVANFNILRAVNIFKSDAKTTTNILLEYFKAPRGDRAEDAVLQTRLLEVNLPSHPQVFEAIMDSDDYKLTHYDKPRIATLCEQAELYQRALGLYTDCADVKRVLANASEIDPQFLLEYFGQLTPKNSLEILHHLLKSNQEQNIRLVVEVAKKWSDFLTFDALIQLFEEFASYKGIVFYLRDMVDTTKDPKVVFKYIEAATICQQFLEVARVCRENEHYNAKEVKDYLLSQKVKDPRPLIHVCDRFGYVRELTQYLYTNNLNQFIEVYVERLNMKALPEVVGTLLDIQPDEDVIRRLLDKAKLPPDDSTFVGKLIESFEKHNRLCHLRKFLEKCKAEGSTDVSVHNALAKIYVDGNHNPESLSTTSSAVLGDLLALADKRAGEVANKYGAFKEQARPQVVRLSLPLAQSTLCLANDRNPEATRTKNAGARRASTFSFLLLVM